MVAMRSTGTEYSRMQEDVYGSDDEYHPSPYISGCARLHDDLHEEVPRRPKKGDPDYIPRPENAWILFRKHIVKKWKEEGTTPTVLVNMPKKKRSKAGGNLNGEVETEPVRRRMRAADLSKLIKVQWQELTPEEKDYWHQQGKECERLHALKYPNYRYTPSLARKNAKSSSKKSASSRKGAKMGLADTFEFVMEPVTMPNWEPELVNPCVSDPLAPADVPSVFEGQNSAMSDSVDDLPAHMADYIRWTSPMSSPDPSWCMSCESDMCSPFFTPALSSSSLESMCPFDEPLCPAEYFYSAEVYTTESTYRAWSSLSSPRPSSASTASSAMITPYQQPVVLPHASISESLCALSPLSDVGLPALPAGESVPALHWNGELVETTSGIVEMFPEEYSSQLSEPYPAASFEPDCESSNPQAHEALLSAPQPKYVLPTPVFEEQAQLLAKQENEPSAETSSPSFVPTVAEFLSSPSTLPKSPELVYPSDFEWHQYVNYEGDGPSGYELCGQEQVVGNDALEIPSETAMSV